MGELHKMLNEDELRDAIVLVFANKQDLPNALSVTELTEKLGLNTLRRKWYVQAACAPRELVSMKVSTGSPASSRSRSRKEVTPFNKYSNRKHLRRRLPIPSFPNPKAHTLFNMNRPYLFSISSLFFTPKTTPPKLTVSTYSR